jgi:hypothetical protein
MPDGAGPSRRDAEKPEGNKARADKPGERSTDDRRDPFPRIDSRGAQEAFKRDKDVDPTLDRLGLKGRVQTNADGSFQIVYGQNSASGNGDQTLVALKQEKGPRLEAVQDGGANTVLQKSLRIQDPKYIENRQDTEESYKLLERIAHGMDDKTQKKEALEGAKIGRLQLIQDELKAGDTQRARRNIYEALDKYPELVRNKEFEALIKSSGISQDFNFRKLYGEVGGNEETLDKMSFSPEQKETMDKAKARFAKLGREGKTEELSDLLATYEEPDQGPAAREYATSIRANIINALAAKGDNAEARKVLADTFLKYPETTSSMIKNAVKSGVLNDNAALQAFLVAGGDFGVLQAENARNR